MVKEVPIWEKSNLTLEEAAAYSGIGINKLRKMTDEQNCQFVLWNGTKRLIKRKKLDEYTETAYVVYQRWLGYVGKMFIWMRIILKLITIWCTTREIKASAIFQ